MSIRFHSVGSALDECGNVLVGVWVAACAAASCVA